MESSEEIFTDEELQNIKNNFTRLKDKTYLDYAGAALCPEIQMKSFTKDLTENLYLNPHTSKYTTDCIDQVRFQILNHFQTDSSEYSLIFTSGATSSLRIVAECFDYISGSGAFVYLHENHTSILGMRDVAESKSAEIIGISREDLFKNIENNTETQKVSNGRALFAYPAQCNFSGYKYPLKWINMIKNGSLNKFTNKAYKEWIVLLDAAAYVSTNKLDLSKYKPDFVSISFYKIFGYPTGLGALLVRNECAELLCNKTYYGGGTVEIAMSRENYHVKRATIHERFEDGTIPFLSIIAVKHGFEALNKMIPKKINDSIMDTTSLYTFKLAQYLYLKMKSLHHSNKKPVFVIYADTSYDNPEKQGGIINFNLIRANGDFIGYAEVVHMAELFDIFLRSGCFCNPGACQRHLNLSNEDVMNHYKAGHKCGDNNDLIDGVPTGSLRISFGYMSTKEDVDRLIDMIVKCFVEGSPIFHPLGVSNVEIKNNAEMKNLTANVENKVKLNEIEEKTSYDSTEVYSKKGILKEIHIYPIKSCGAFKVDKKWEICEKGLKYDRDWMIVDESGVAVTQKRDTRICLIKPIVDLKTDRLFLTFPGVNDVSIPLDIKSTVIKSTTICHSKVCGDKIQGYDCGNEVADWLMDVLGLPGVRLLRQTDEDRKQKSKKPGAENASISLNNQAQYLLINTASVKWLSDRVKSQEFEGRLENLVLRFRGNFIIETEKEFQELKWSKMRIGSNIFKIQEPCTRCQMICIDQESGEKTTEPLRTISKEFQGKLNFGIYLSYENIQNDKKTLIECDQTIWVLEN